MSGVLLDDYCKAFDMLTTISTYSCWNWRTMVLTTGCQSYLSGRSQLVCINGKNSSLACMNHRVPEGYIWVLFVILFTNDLPRHVTAQVDLYADDTTITCSADYKSMHKLEHDLNNSVAEIQNWAVSNKLPINVDKTDVMIVTGKNIESKLDFQPSGKLSDHEHFTVNSKVHSRNTRYAKFNFVFLKYIREIGGEKSSVRACKLWNKLFLELKRKDFFSHL